MREFRHVQRAKVLPTLRDEGSRDFEGIPVRAPVRVRPSIVFPAMQLNVAFHFVECFLSPFLLMMAAVAATAADADGDVEQ